MIFDLWGTLVDPFPEGAGDEIMGPMAAALGADADEFLRRWGELYEERMRGAAIEEHLALLSTARPWPRPPRSAVRTSASSFGRGTTSSGRWRSCAPA